MDDEIRFYVEHAGRVTGPVTDDELRDSLRDGRVDPGARVRLAGSDLWTSPRAFATFARRPGSSGTPPPGAPVDVADELPPELDAAPRALRDMLLFWVHEGAHTFGPLTGEQLRRGYESGHYRSAFASLIDAAPWYPVSLIVAAHDPAEPSISGARAWSAPIVGAREPSVAPEVTTRRPEQLAIYLGAAAPGHEGRTPRDPARAADVAVPAVSNAIVRCSVCLERIAAGLAVCPECGEPVTAPSPSGPGSIPDDSPDASWLRMHWRPLVTMGAMAALVCTGIALRYLAPGRFLPSRIHAKPAGAALTPAACSSPCWNGEACEIGRCV